jgi:hypothetical protein
LPTAHQIKKPQKNIIAALLRPIAARWGSQTFSSTEGARLSRRAHNPQSGGSKEGCIPLKLHPSLLSF